MGTRKRRVSAKEARFEERQIKKEKKKKRNNKIIISVAIIIVAILTTLIVAGNYYNPTNRVAGHWDSVRAEITDTKEAVDMNEIYQVRYSNYKGGLILNKDKTFSFWLTIGEPDGTNSGKYKADKDTIYLDFDSGDKAEFKYEMGSNNKAEIISAPYGIYTVFFERG